jgi:hypothetical protein
LLRVRLFPLACTLGILTKPTFIVVLSPVEMVHPSTFASSNNTRPSPFVANLRFAKKNPHDRDLVRKCRYLMRTGRFRTDRYRSRSQRAQKVPSSISTLSRQHFFPHCSCDIPGGGRHNFFASIANDKNITGTRSREGRQPDSEEGDWRLGLRGWIAGSYGCEAARGL